MKVLQASCRLTAPRLLRACGEGSGRREAGHEVRDSLTQPRATARQTSRRRIVVEAPGWTEIQQLGVPVIFQGLEQNDLDLT